jgi:hypothetical protein
MDKPIHDMDVDTHPDVPPLSPHIPPTPTPDDPPSRTSPDRMEHPTLDMLGGAHGLSPFLSPFMEPANTTLDELDNPFNPASSFGDILQPMLPTSNLEMFFTPPPIPFLGRMSVPDEHPPLDSSPHGEAMALAESDLTSLSSLGSAPAEDGNEDGASPGHSTTLETQVE